MCSAAIIQEIRVWVEDYRAAFNLKAHDTAKSDEKLAQRQ